MHYVVAIASRYGALAIQFLIVVLVTRFLTQQEAGSYFMAFGAVATLFCIAGFGLPDGLVKNIGERISSDRLKGVRRTIEVSWLFTIFSCVFIAILASVIAIYAGMNWGIAIGTSAWWLCYTIVFFCAQSLVSLRFAGLGSFFFYTSTNLCFLVTSVPYLIFAKQPGLNGVIFASTGGAAISMCAACAVLLQKLKNLEAGGHAEMLPAWQTGFWIAIARMLQAMLYWVPVWIAGIMLSAEDASLIGTAGRLLIAVAAVIAALRFSVRPEIVKAAAEGDWTRIVIIWRRMSLFAIATTLFSIIFIYMIGPTVIKNIFGDAYAMSIPLLIILLVGVLGEAIGGPVDEILKMTGRTTSVLIGLIVAIAFEVSVGVYFSSSGLKFLAWTQAFTFCGMYAYQMLVLSRHLKISRKNGAKT